MQWLSENWVFLLVGVAFFAMHLFGHGAHGGHGGNDSRKPSGRNPAARDDQRPPASGHRH